MSLKELFNGTPLSRFSGDVLALVWAKFSDIQGSTFLCPCDECLARFLGWVETGGDESAWIRNKIRGREEAKTGEGGAGFRFRGVIDSVIPTYTHPHTGVK